MLKKLLDNNLITILYFLLVALLDFLILEASVTIRFSLTNPKYLFCGFCFIVLINLALVSIFGKPTIAIIVNGFLCTLIGIVNYYVLIYHGTPLTLMELKNAGTAANVIGGYELKIGKTIIGMIIILVFEIVVSVVIFGKKSWKRKYSISALLVMLVIVGFEFCSGLIVPEHIHFWTWNPVLNEYGYTCGVVKYTISTISYAQKPEGYKEKDVADFCDNYEVEKSANNTPDIILILNETYYDIHKIADIETDVDYMGPFNDIDGLIRGYAINPVMGGHTNASEYEYLSSNSMMMLPGITPFTTLNLKDSNTVVSYFEQLGYSSLAAHPAVGSNYNRNNAYRDLGFDEIHFIEDFTKLAPYYNRDATDSSMYQDSLKWYEEMGDSPRFMYLLTFQNHASYEQNPPEADLVHVKDRNLENAEIVDEYLTSIYMSTIAFKELTDYFANSDRDVIICMVGDHCPPFTESMVDEKYMGEDVNLLLRSVPYVIWANNKSLLEGYKVDSEAISMAYLVPTVAETAGVQLSGYYDFLIKQREELPIMDMTDDSLAYRKIEYLNIKKPNLNKRYFVNNEVERQ